VARNLRCRPRLLILSQAGPSRAQQAGGGVGAARAPVPAQAQPQLPPQPAPPASNAVRAFSRRPRGSGRSPAAAADTGRFAGIGRLRELSPWSMFLSADLLVKAVMIGLVFASLVTWTIFLAKTIQLSRARKQLSEALARIADTRSLSEAQLALGSTTNVLSALLSAAMQEIRISADSGVEAGIKERAASHFSEIVRMEARAVRYGMAVIATIGATAPFVGLFARCGES